MTRQQLGLKFWIGGDGIERVGIEHGPGRAGQHPGDDGFNCFAASATADDNLVFQIQRLGRSEHELGLQRVHMGSVRPKQGDENPASPSVQGSAGGQQGGARHVGGRRGRGLAPDYGDITKTALVAGMRSLRFAGLTGMVKAQQPGARLCTGFGGPGISAERIEPHLACAVSPAGREEAGLQSQKTQGKCGSCPCFIGIVCY